MITTQRTEDKKNREEIMRKYRAFVGDINKRLGFTSKTKIEAPVDPEKATDIKKTDQAHSSRKVPPREYAYVNVKQVNLRSEPGTRGNIVGRAVFQEKFEVVVQSEEKDWIDDVEARWILVRKTSETADEGWIFGAYLQKELPDREKDFARPEDKSTIKTSSFMVPATGYRSSNFGYRVNPVTKKSDQFHSGIDIAAAMGTPVKAAAGGIVKISEFNKNGYGNLVVIEHEKDLSTYYGHLSKLMARAGQKVAKGDLIGNVGSTGWSTGPHLHFEVRKGGTALNPDDFIALIIDILRNLI